MENNNMPNHVLKILLILVCCSIFLVPIKSAYSDTILGTGTSIQTDGKTGHGTLGINSVTYQAPNLTIEMGKIVKISGDIFVGTEKSKLSLSGTNVKDVTYELSGFVTGKNGTKHVKLVLYIVGENPKATTNSIQKNIKLDQLELVVKSFDKVIVGYSYGFSVKAFDKKLNPTGSYDQMVGKLASVNVSVVFKDKNNNVLKTFHGITDNQGYYSDSERIVNYLPSVTYHVVFNATKSGYLSDSITKTVFVQPNSR